MLPANWYLAGGPLRKGQLYTPDLGPLECVVFRGQTGALVGLSAHCGHLGAHLGGGSVVGDCLQCPLHHWRYGADGKCKLARQRVYPVEDTLGAVFLHSGESPSAFPSLFIGSGLASQIGQPWILDCPWQAVALNAFDAQHLAGVHGRQLLDSQLERLPDRFVWRYRSRVTGNGLARLISGDRIQATITCHRGTLLTVESQFGAHWGGLVISLVPLSETSCQARPLFLTRHAWQLRIARYFFESFLKADLGVLKGMRPDRPQLLLPEDENLRQLLEYLQQ